MPTTSEPTVKVGDTLAFRRTLAGGYVLRKVLAITAAGFVKCSGGYVLMPDLRIRGRRANDVTVVFRLTPEIQEEIDRDKILKSLQGFDWDVLTTEQLRQVQAELQAKLAATQPPEKGA